MSFSLAANTIDSGSPCLRTQCKCLEQSGRWAAVSFSTSASSGSTAAHSSILRHMFLFARNDLKFKSRLKTNRDDGLDYHLDVDRLPTSGVALKCVHQFHPSPGGCAWWFQRRFERRFSLLHGGSIDLPVGLHGCSLPGLSK